MTLLPSLSVAALNRLHLALVGVLLAAGAVFYPLQNSGTLPGGEIAPQKMVWLGVAIYWFFVVPLVVWLDARCARLIRATMGVFLAAMSLRGLIELVMIYQTLGWSPVMGLSFNLAALAGLVGMLWVTRESRHDTGWHALAGLSVAMIAECAFVVYFHLLVAPDGGTMGADAVYFVAADSGHGAVLLASLVASLGLIGLALWLFLPRRRRASHG